MALRPGPCPHSDLQATARPTRRGASWHPPRAASMPTLAESPSPDIDSVVASGGGGGYPPGDVAANAAGDVDRLPRAPSPALATRGTSPAISARRRQSSKAALDDGPLPERSALSAERYKDECLRLKAEVSDRREETRHLQQRMRLLEGSLQVRMQQMELFVEEMRQVAGAAARDTHGAGAPASGCSAAKSASGEADGRRFAELLDRLIHEARRTQVMLHCHADSGARLEAKDRLLEQAQQGLERQDMLKEQLLESQLETKRLAAKVRESDQSCLRQKLEQARRSSRKKDELLAEYERTQSAMHDRLEMLKHELEDERRARREQERAKQRLIAQLEEAHCGGPCTAETTLLTPTSNPAQGTASAALRSELEALREEERALRRMRRRLRNQEGSTAASPEPHYVGGATGSTSIGQASVGARDPILVEELSRLDRELHAARSEQRRLLDRRAAFVATGHDDGAGDAVEDSAIAVAERIHVLEEHRGELQSAELTSLDRDLHAARVQQRERWDRRAVLASSTPGGAADPEDVAMTDRIRHLERFKTELQSEELARLDRDLRAAKSEQRERLEARVGVEPTADAGAQDHIDLALASRIQAFERRRAELQEDAGVGHVDSGSHPSRCGSKGGRESAATSALRAAFRDASSREAKLREELLAADLRARDASDRETRLRDEIAAADRRSALFEEGSSSERWAAQAAERYTRLELEVSEKQVAGSEAIAAEATRTEGQIREHARNVECRCWMLAEVVNELALQADLRELDVIQAEVDMQRELQAAELRCATVAAVANGVTNAIKGVGLLCEP